MHLQSGASLPHLAARSIGYADFVTGETVTGWAIDLQAPQRPLRLQVSIDGAAIDDIACELARDDVRAAGIESDVGGFRYDLPTSFADGQDHTLRLDLPGGKAVCFPLRDGAVHTEHVFRLNPSSTVEGCVDAPSADAVEGWVLRRDRSGRQVPGCEVAVMLGGAQVGRIVADLHRADVAHARDCDARVGFRFAAPSQLRHGRELRLEFCALPEGTPLAGSPRTVTFLPADATSRLAALAAEVDSLFTQAYMVRRRLQEFLPGPAHSVDDYEPWARRYRAALHARAAAERRQDAPAPLISVVCPVFRPTLAHVAAAVDSVRAQTYPHWELILVDDASRSAPLTAYLRGLAAEDARIRVQRNGRNGGIAAATNDAVAAARGAWVAFLDHDDLLDPVALEVMLRAAQASGARALYSDEDKIETDGRAADPHLKPDWNERLALDVNFVCHLLMVQSGLLDSVRLPGGGVLDPALDGAQDHDLVLRLATALGGDGLHHVPEILYHWRKSPGSTALAASAKSYAVVAGQAAVQAHLARSGFAHAVARSRDAATQYRVDWGFVAEPDVCIVIPFRDQAETTRICVELLLARTEYGNFHVILVDNGSTTEAAAALCRELATDSRVSVLRDDLPFNYARLNNRAIRGTTASLVLLLNNDVLVEQGDWLRRMVDETLADPKVAAVGCKLLYPDRRVQHAGVVLGVGGVADHAFKGLEADDSGYVARALCAQEYAAVTAACLLCRTEAYRAVGGLDQEALAVAFNDVDLCIKLRQAGWRVIWTPDVVAEHHESLSRGDDMTERNRTRFITEHQVMIERWGETLAHDPFYSRHFSREGGVFRSLADESLLLPAVSDADVNAACETAPALVSAAPHQRSIHSIASHSLRRKTAARVVPPPATRICSATRTDTLEQEFSP